MPEIVPQLTAEQWAKFYAAMACMTEAFRELGATCADATAAMKAFADALPEETIRELDAEILRRHKRKMVIIWTICTVLFVIGMAIICIK